MQRLQAMPDLHQQEVTGINKALGPHHHAALGPEDPTISLSQGFGKDPGRGCPEGRDIMQR